MLTWKLLRHGRRVYFEPLAVAFTSAPEDFAHVRPPALSLGPGHDRGPAHRATLAPAAPLTRALTAVDLAIPFLDTAYVFAWLPGLVLACFGHFWLVGPMTIAVLPAHGASSTRCCSGDNGATCSSPLGLRVRKNWLALVAFLLVYQVLMSRCRSGDTCRNSSDIGGRGSRRPAAPVGTVATQGRRWQ